MELPLRLKWLGGETEPVCALLGRYHPLILISPAPRTPKTSAGLLALPAAFSSMWNLRSPEAARRGAELDAGAGRKFEFEELEPAGGTWSDAAVHEFYFKVYLKSVALRPLLGVPVCLYVEDLNRRLLDGDFVVFIRATAGGEVVAGCLLRRPRSREADGDVSLPGGLRLRDENIAEEGVLFFDLLAADPRFQDDGLARLMLARAAGWARRAGYGWLSTPPRSPVSVNSDGYDATWTFGAEGRPVFYGADGALLYCDLTRCSYLPRDIYYYADEPPGPCLYYVANACGERSQAVDMLNSVAGVRKRVYTRRPQLQRAIAEAGIECTLLG